MKTLFFLLIALSSFAQTTEHLSLPKSDTFSAEFLEYVRQYNARKYDPVQIDRVRESRKLVLMISRCDECVLETIIGYFTPAEGGIGKPTYYDKEHKVLDPKITVWMVKEY
jgi:hypothetical protein